MISAGPSTPSLMASLAKGHGPKLIGDAQHHSNPGAFLRLHPEKSETGASLFVATLTKDGTAEVETVSTAVIRLLTAIDHPNAFYVRLLNKKAGDFPSVERFFGDIVDATVQKMGYRRLEMGTDRTERGFINVEIFERLHYSELAIADVRGERPNCFVALGYALGHSIPVIVTAKEGTILPFDQQAIPCHFWNLEAGTVRRRASSGTIL